MSRLGPLFELAEHDQLGDGWWFGDLHVGGDAERPTGFTPNLVDLDARVDGGQGQLVSGGVGSQYSEVGDDRGGSAPPVGDRPVPSFPNPTDVTKSTVSTNIRFFWRSMTRT